MKAVGLVVEYNPFHNGHLYHLQASKEKAEADTVIAVMSGHFLQRGEPALVSKWSRAKMALQQGADLVVELPYAFATQKAEFFADGAISILEALKCHSVCFGSENGEITPFLETAKTLEELDSDYQDAIKYYMKQGISYPSAQTKAYQSLDTGGHTLDLSMPNNILGYQYVKAIQKQGSAISPLTIKRTSAGYHDEEFNETSIASATSIRKAIFSEENKDIQSFVPETTWDNLKTYRHDFNTFHQWEDYFGFLKYTICTMTHDELKQIYEVEEGLENRVKSLIHQAASFKDFMEQLKTKRYTWTRLQRLCLHILTRTTKDQMKLDETGAPYLRLLGMSSQGRAYLNSIKKTVDKPLVSTLSAFSHPILDLDIKAASVYAMVFPEPIRSQFMHSEYSTRPIQYNETEKLFL
ncbi:nucleotidyltransferase [Peribacillus frigoritolerans]|uniref:nucleotidyltransferase n=1 Tax=Peribacillus frigoritolerans TaxID=450367 RepID=UPI00105A396E|nr:nucleotidyltransferase [Peribacillus frigoritolerans]TDL79984.1 nucleotidyltransferase [Peribacillus frigoritolerans]